MDAIISVGYRVNSTKATLFRRYDILPDKGRISKAKADAKAQAEYDLFNPTQLIISDFDRVVKRLNGPKS